MSIEKKHFAMPAIMAVASIIVFNAVARQVGEHPAPMGTPHKKIVKSQTPIIDTGRLKRRTLDHKRFTAVRPKPKPNAKGDVIGKLLAKGKPANKTKVASKATLEAQKKIRFVQSRLTKLGYDTGPVDGLMGQKTRDAIKKFENARKIPVTGEVSGKLLEALSQRAKILSQRASFARLRVLNFENLG